MEDIEIIKDCYRSNKVKVDQDYLNDILKDKKRIEQFKELHKRIKIWNMNYILGKPLENTEFKEFELKELSKLDLFNNKLLNFYKYIYENRNNLKKLEELQKKLNLELKKKKEKINGDSSTDFR